MQRDDFAAARAAICEHLESALGRDALESLEECVRHVSADAVDAVTLRRAQQTLDALGVLVAAAEVQGLPECAACASPAVGLDAEGEVACPAHGGQRCRVCGDVIDGGSIVVFSDPPEHLHCYGDSIPHPVITDDPEPTEVPC